MKKKTKKEPIGKIRIVKDFLPPPEKLVLKNDTVKVTLSLTKQSIDFFKHQAKKQHIKYQVMIRSLLDQYASHFNK